MPQTNDLDQLCFCGSGGDLRDCCLPFINNEKLPQDAEQLMRSRFSAFCLARGDYLYETHHPDFRENLSAEELAEAARNRRWVKLEVFTQSPLSEEVSQVAFKAWYLEGDRLIPHAELSFFHQVDGRWLYTRGEIDSSLTDIVKLGRNDPCPCGSGRKFKKCCLGG